MLLLAMLFMVDVLFLNGADFQFTPDYKVSLRRRLSLSALSLLISRTAPPPS